MGVSDAFFPVRQFDPKGRYVARSYLTSTNLANNLFVHPLIDDLHNEFYARAQSASYSYPDLYELRCEMERYFERSLAGFCLSPGSDQAIRGLIAGATDFDKVVCVSPDYWGYALYAKQAGKNVIEIPISALSTREKITEYLQNLANYLLFVSSPNSIFGNIIDENLLVYLCNRALVSGGMVIVDAAYAAFSDRSFAHLVDRVDNLIVLQTLSKSHGLASARVAAIIGREPIISRIASLNLEACISASGATLAAYHLRHEKRFVSARNDIILGRQALATFFLGMREQVIVSESRANFITLRFSSPDRAQHFASHVHSKEFAVRLLDRWPNTADCVRVTSADQQTVHRFIAAASLFG